MGHRISAVVLKGRFDEKLAGVFDLKPIRLSGELTMFPLSAAYADHWSDKLGISGFVDDVPLLNCNAVHHMVRYIAPEALFAVIETDYFGGRGTQSAAVYRGKVVVLPPESSSGGPINKALRLLGVTARKGADEFDTVGLGTYRHFDDVLESYEDS
jgi:hypothetical protein